MPRIDGNTARYERKRIMKRTALRARKIPLVPADFGSAARWDDPADLFEDRVAESLVDYDDEREALEAVVPRTNHSLN